MVATSNDLFTISAAARALERSESAIRKAANSGRLPFITTTTGQRLFRRGDVEAFRAARDRAHDADPTEAA
jgi:hypothetical protein